MKIHLFGYSNPVGQSFLELVSKEDNNLDINLYSKSKRNAIYLDLESDVLPNNFKLDKSSILVSFAPIWSFSNFIEKLNSQKIFFRNVDMIICCSSSSSITKRFSFNNFDKDLSKRLYYSEEKIKEICLKNKIICKIIQPTLIYGNFGKYKDKNINLLRKIIRISPLLLLPDNVGLRQPIHAIDLAEIFYNLIIEKDNKKFNLKDQNVPVGGHETFSYIEMLERIKGKLPKNTYENFCFFIKIPNRLFFFLTSPLILLSPKLYESILRISINLSGFKTYKGKRVFKFPRS